MTFREHNIAFERGRGSKERRGEQNIAVNILKTI